MYDTVMAAIDAPNFDQASSNIVKYTTASRYRYDALGRRVWARVERARDNAPERLSGCASPITRTVWDGVRILAEFQGQAARADHVCAHRSRCEQLATTVFHAALAIRNSRFQFLAAVRSP